MPLVDRVLIPQQSGEHVTIGTAMPYLAGLAVAAILASSLGWGRTWILAWVSDASRQICELHLCPCAIIITRLFCHPPNW